MFHKRSRFCSKSLAYDFFRFVRRPQIVNTPLDSPSIDCFLVAEVPSAVLTNEGTGHRIYAGTPGQGLLWDNLA